MEYNHCQLLLNKQEQRRLDRRHVSNFGQSDSLRYMLMADRENFPKERELAVNSSFSTAFLKLVDWKDFLEVAKKIFLLVERIF